MASFSKMGAFPAGYFRGIAKWLLQNRRDLPARIGVISAEIARIGIIRVDYEMYADSEGNQRATERPIGFSVTEGSNLAHLVRAYVANGGNPFNISKFLLPNTTRIQEGADSAFLVEQYPGGGVVAPKSASYNDPLPVPDIVGPPVEASDDAQFRAPSRTGYENFTGGHLNTDRYYPNRMGARMDRGSWDSDTVVRVMHDVRRWANQDIKTRVQDMEWRILKQMDLLEQLQTERDTIIAQAFGGLQNGIPPFDDQGFRPERMVPAILDEMAKLIAVVDPKTAEIIGTGANAQTGFLSFVFPDAASETLNTL
jgi:hypothetical protein